MKNSSTAVSARHAESGWRLAFASRPVEQHGGDGVRVARPARGRRRNARRRARPAVAFGSAASDGSWAFSAPVPEASWATGIATLATLGEDRDRARSSVGWLLGQQGRSLGWYFSLLYRVAPSLMSVRLNPDLRGWPWRSHATGFVEPTAYSLIVLKMRPHTDTRAEARIQEAEAMLYDRMCPNGGWNYGNSVVLGVDLPPYADVTALTLIALQDHRGSEPNAVSLAALRRMLAEVDSSLALAWATLCLSLYGEDTESLRGRLERRYRSGRTWSIHDRWR